jgi:hypothetical protein
LESYKKGHRNAFKENKPDKEKIGSREENPKNAIAKNPRTPVHHYPKVKPRLPIRADYLPKDG